MGCASSPTPCLLWRHLLKGKHGIGFAVISLLLAEPTVSTSPPRRDLDHAVLWRGIVYLLDLTPGVDPKQLGAQKWEGDVDYLSSVSMHSAPCQSKGERKRECMGINIYEKV